MEATAAVTAEVEPMKKQRLALRLSQSELARLSNVSRYKIWASEIGTVVLKQAEHEAVARALRAEHERRQEDVAAAFCWA